MRHERKIARLRHYDYRSNGAYAVTICSFGKRMVFGRIENGAMRLHPFGAIVEQLWLMVPDHFPIVELDEFQVMPNHFHAILWIENEAPPTPAQEAELRQFGKPQPGSLGTIIGSFKSAVTKAIGEKRECKTRVWQPRFFDHIIRDDRDLETQRRYIENNPANWPDDELNADV